MRRVLQLACSLALPLLLLTSVGCDKSYKITSVSGHVTMDHRPLAGAEVSFYPIAGGKDAPYASGTTDSQGNYKLEVFMGGSTSDGAVVGENRVQISRSKLHSEKKINPKNMSGGLDDVPAKYNRDSTLTFTVPPEGTQAANFELTSK
jgi:hypothetical protein